MLSPCKFSPNFKEAALSKIMINMLVHRIPAAGFSLIFAAVEKGSFIV
jgi:hypothetical protein